MVMNREGATAPEVTTVDDMLRLMRQGTQATYDIRMRAMTFTVRVLSLDETNEIRRWSIAEAQKRNGDKVDMNVEMQKATLRLATTLTSRGAPVISDRLLEQLTTDEVNYLFEEYIAVIDRVNPSIETMREDEFRTLVDALKKNTITSRDCSLRQLRTICTSYADLIRRLDEAESPPVS